MMARTRRRSGVTLAEVLVLIFIIAAVGMAALMALPRTRETARLNSCNEHLRRIGAGLIQYDAAMNHLPAVPNPGEAGPAPLATLAEQFGLPWFEDVQSKAVIRGPVTPRRVRTFLCPADPNLVRPDPFRAPVSYRANAGSGTAGSGGPFAFGVVKSIRDAERGAGKDYTAAFSERLMGSGPTTSPVNDYQLMDGPIDPETCPPGPADSWRGDAGSSWAESGWKSTLYNHAMRPNESPSCIAIDGKTARMGASSAHDNRVNVLMLGGSVQGFTAGADRVIWRKLGALSAEDRAK